ncbi:MAG TPA: c-type cytochrome, partial [Geminicoccaceae bacterium]|nr:c-type cytochrome [Geminicoccaceae bacterium]
MLLAAVTSPPAPAVAQSAGDALAPPPAIARDAPAIARGRALAEEHCAACHAIGAEGTSRVPTAPAFRVLEERYPVET